MQIGFNSAEIFSRQRKDLDRVARGCVEFLRSLQRLAESWLLFQPGVEALIVVLDLGKEIIYVLNTGFPAELFETIGFLDERRIVQQLLDFAPIDHIAATVIGVGNVDLRQHRRVGECPGVGRILS